MEEGAEKGDEEEENENASNVDEEKDVSQDKESG